MNDIFSQALNISSPWIITDLKFDTDLKQLDIQIDFKSGTKFKYESKAEGITGEFSVHDTVKKTWRHLNFFEHECYLHTRTPRIKLNNGKVRQIQPPWAGKSNGFTLLFEALLLQLCCEMPVNAVSRLTSVDDNKIWRMLNTYIEKAREYNDFSEVTQIGLDETSRQKHHDYVTLFVDLKKRKTIFVTDGKDNKTVNEFCKDFESHKGSSKKITDVSSDMSPAFIKGIGEYLPNAKITFDKFHLIKVINTAVSEVRRDESKENDLLKGTKNIFDKNRDNMTIKQLIYLESKLEIKSLRLKTVRALHLREAFQEIYKSESKDEFVKKLKKWYSWAIRSQLEPMKNAAKTIKSHWEGIIEWYDSGINNGILEGLNSLIQSAKSKARGFKTSTNFKIIIYLVTGNLSFSKVNKCYKSLKY